MASERPEKPANEREDSEDHALSDYDRRKAIEDTAGVLAGIYPPGYLEELRRDWPE